jgi:cytochrome b
MKSFRLLHALFAIASLAAYLTAEELGLVHAWLGYGIGSLVLLRIVLGLAGKAGFSSHRLIPRRSTTPLGMNGIRHPIVAQILTLALALNISGAAVTGIAIDRGGTLTGQSIRAEDGENERGDKAHGGENRREEEKDDDEASLFNLATPAYADDGKSVDDEGEGPLAELHELFGSLLVPLALVHIAYLLAFRFDMARFMLFVPRRKASAATPSGRSRLP